MKDLLAKRLLRQCIRELDQGDMFGAELTLNDFFKLPGERENRPLRRFDSGAMEKLGVLFLTMGLPGTPESVEIWNELKARGMTPDEIAEEFELDSTRAGELEA